MPERSDVHNFGAGPAWLPDDLLEVAARDLLNYDGTGMGLGELSHRSKPAVALVMEAQRQLRELLDIPSTHQVLFQQGGGVGQFSAIVYNMFASRAQELSEERARALQADYLVTGSWSAKAAKEARRLGMSVNIALDSRDEEGLYRDIPSAESWLFTTTRPCAYLYYCDNETIDGVEFPFIPQHCDSSVPIVCDMSSNILSRRFDVSKFALIFATAQKNFGLAGLTVIIVHEKYLAPHPTPEYLQHLGIPVVPLLYSYPETFSANSLLNTLPMFPLRLASLMMGQLLEKGGLDAQEERNNIKAHLVYRLLDRAEEDRTVSINPRRNCRSRINVPFRFIEEEQNKEFIEQAISHGFLQLEGHRSVGGVRISLYNNVPYESVQKLVDFLKHWSRK